MRRRCRRTAAIGDGYGPAFPLVNPRIVGLAGLEPAPSSLSEMDGRPPCSPAFFQVVRLRKCHRDEVNPGPLLGRALRLLGDQDPHEKVDHDAGAAEQGEDHEQHPDQGRVGVEVLGQAPHTPASLRLVRLRYSLRVWAMAPPFARCLQGKLTVREAVVRWVG